MLPQYKISAIRGCPRRSYQFDGSVLQLTVPTEYPSTTTGTSVTSSVAVNIDFCGYLRFFNINKELEEITKGENIVRWIKGQRIWWLGHLERMEEERMPKRIFNQELEGTRRKGRPRKRWIEEVEEDLQVMGVRRWRSVETNRKNLQVMGVRRWRSVETNRTEWMDIVQQAKAHNGL